MSSSQDFTAYKTLPYNVYARAAGKWDYLQENQFFNSSQTVNISMTDYNGLSMTADTQGASALSLDFSNTILPWKWDYYNYLLENKYCFMPAGQWYYGVYVPSFNTTDWILNNAVVVSADFVASNFSNDNIIYCRKTFAPTSGDTWEVRTKFTCSVAAATQRIIGGGTQYGGFGFSYDAARKFWFGLSSNGTSWNIANTSTSSYPTVDNKIYWVKIQFTGTNYIVTISDDNWLTSTQLFNVSSSTVISSITPRIGKASGSESTSYWRGSVYLADTYIKLNNQYWSKLVDMEGETAARQGCTYNYTDDGSAVTLNAFVVNGDETIILTPDNSYPNGYLLGTVNIPAHDVYTYSESTEPWTQPVLSADGTIGGNSFAVYSNGVLGSGYEAWKAFDGNSSTYWWSHSGTDNYLGFYNPNPLTVSNIKIKNSQQAITDYEFQYSDNGIEWTIAVTGTNTNTTSGGEWDFNVNAGAHPYWRIVAKTAGYKRVVEMVITAHTGTGTWTVE